MYFGDDGSDFRSFGSWCDNNNCTLPTDHKSDPSKQDCKLRDIIAGENATPSTGFQFQSPIPWKEKCRHAPTPVFRIKDGGVTYYGGSDSKVKEFEFSGLVVCLLGRDTLIKSKKPVRSTGDWARKLDSYMETDKPHPNYMTIDWPDYSTPPVLPGFFKKLHQEVVNKGIKEVLFFCMGGHGRTGTALAATLIELCNMGSAEATEWIHEKYCTEAIESDSQKNYLKDIAGEAAL